MNYTDAKTHQADRLRQLTSDIFTACEVSPEDAQVLANHLVGANLKGLDSHGVLRIPQYVGNIRKNEIVPGAGIETVRETATMALLDLNWNFGQIGARTATGMAVAKAGRQGLGSVALYRTQHVGCLSLYTGAIAGAGMVGLAACSGGSPSGHWVAPWGGREGRIGTNPISLGGPDDRATDPVRRGYERHLGRQGASEQGQRKEPARHLACRRGRKAERRPERALLPAWRGHPAGGWSAGL